MGSGDCGADAINITSPGVPPKLGNKHRAFLARPVEEGPIPAVHGVVRWRACDLIMRLQEEFGISVSDDTIYQHCGAPSKQACLHPGSAWYAFVLRLHSARRTSFDH